ncbi:MAG: hypothetical protein ACE360_03675 [Hyphomicrobiales bacterium]
MRHFLKPLTLALCVGPLLAGCAGSIGDTFDDLNPFNREDPPIPGERRAVGRAADPVLAVTTHGFDPRAFRRHRLATAARRQQSRSRVSSVPRPGRQAGIVSGRRQVRMAALSGSSLAVGPMSTIQTAM